MHINKIHFIEVHILFCNINVHVFACIFRFKVSRIMFIVEKVDRLWEEFGGLSELPKEGKFKIPKENLFSDKCYSKIY